MKTFTVISLFVMTLITVPVPARASDSTGRNITFGRGTEPCATQVTPYRLHIDAVIWTAGFLSAYNDMASDTYDITSFNSEWDSWIAEYCRLNPQLQLVHAVHAYIRAAYPTRTVSRPPVVTPDMPQQRAVKNRNRY